MTTDVAWHDLLYINYYLILRFCGEYWISCFNLLNCFNYEIFHINYIPNYINQINYGIEWKKSVTKNVYKGEVEKIREKKELQLKTVAKSCWKISDIF